MLQMVALYRNSQSKSTPAALSYSTEMEASTVLPSLDIQTPSLQHDIKNMKEVILLQEKEIRTLKVCKIAK